MERITFSQQTNNTGTLTGGRTERKRVREIDALCVSSVRQIMLSSEQRNANIVSYHWCHSSNVRAIANGNAFCHAPPLMWTNLKIVSIHFVLRRLMGIPKHKRTISIPQSKLAFDSTLRPKRGEIVRRGRRREIVFSLAFAEWVTRGFHVTGSRQRLNIHFCACVRSCTILCTTVGCCWRRWLIANRSANEQLYRRLSLFGNENALSLHAQR